MRVFKQQRRQGERVVIADHYSGSFRLPWMTTKTTVALKTQDKEIAEKRLRQLVQVRELEHEGRPVPSHLWGAPKRGIAALLTEYQATVASKGRNAKHVHDTVKRVETLSAACCWASIDGINANDFERWRAGTPVNPRTKRKLSIKTVNEYLVSIRSFVHWLRKLGYLERDPLEFVQKGETRGNEEKRRRVWADEDLDSFMKNGKPPYRADYRIAVWLLRWTGLRKNELQSLLWSDVSINDADRFLVVRAKHSKNRKAERVPLMANVAAKLREMRPAQFKQTDKVLPFRIPGSEQLKADLARAGVVYRTEDGDLDFHALRYSFGHWLASEGASIIEIQAILRHSDPSTTAKHYMNVIKLSETKSMTALYEGNHCTPVCTPVTGSEGPELSQRDTTNAEHSKLQMLEDKIDRLTQALSGTLGHNVQNGCPGWDRTSDKVVNSHLLYR